MGMDEYLAWVGDEPESSGSLLRDMTQGKFLGMVLHYARAIAPGRSADERDELMRRVYAGNYEVSDEHSVAQLREAFESMGLIFDLDDFNRWLDSPTYASL